MGLMVKEVKGGVFAPTDYPVIKRALHSYLIECMRTEGVHLTKKVVKNNMYWGAL
jgi:hypothetical protein